MSRAKLNRAELVERATRLKIKTIKMHTPNANTSYTDWYNFFSSRHWSNKALKQLIQQEEERHARYLHILLE